MKVRIENRRFNKRNRNLGNSILSDLIYSTFVDIFIFCIYLEMERYNLFVIDSGMIDLSIYPNICIFIFYLYYQKKLEFIPIRIYLIKMYL